MIHSLNVLLSQFGTSFNCHFLACIQVSQDTRLNIKKTKIMASSPITSWEIDGETVETVVDFVSWGSKISVDGECSHEIKDAYSLEGKL